MFVVMKFVFVTLFGKDFIKALTKPRFCFRNKMKIEEEEFLKLKGNMKSKTKTVSKKAAHEGSTGVCFVPMYLNAARNIKTASHTGGYSSLLIKVRLSSFYP